MRLPAYLLLLPLVGAIEVASAAEATADVQALRQQMETLQKRYEAQQNALMVLEQRLRAMEARGPQQAAAPQQAAPSAAPDMTKQLTDLKGLLDNGILTQEEFDAKKKQILGL